MSYALLLLLQGFIFLVIHLVIGRTFHLQSLGDSEFAYSHSHLARFLHMIPTIYGERFKFYFAWKMAEGGCVIAGFGFEGYDRDGNAIGWRGVENVDIWRLETAPNIQDQSRYWNKRTQQWLERYTYNRTGQSLIMTYFVSSLWHGLYPGDYDRLRCYIGQLT
jgi:lysophospholipid acyltransferase